MRLQSVTPQDYVSNLIKLKPIEGLPVFDRGENVLCHLRHDQIFDKKHFPRKLERRRHGVVERASLKEIPPR